MFFFLCRQKSRKSHFDFSNLKSMCDCLKLYQTKGEKQHMDGKQKKQMGNRKNWSRRFDHFLHSFLSAFRCDFDWEESIEQSFQI